MKYLGVDSNTALVEIVHLNGRQMPGHRPMHVSPETRALLRSITKPLPPGEPTEAPPVALCGGKGFSQALRVGFDRAQ